MAMRIRISGNQYVALCAANTNEQEGDIYLDDAVDSAVRRKLFEDWRAEYEGGGDVIAEKQVDLAEKDIEIARLRELVSECLVEDEIAEGHGYGALSSDLKERARRALEQ